MESMTLTAEVRTARGKGPARRLRAEGKVPAVIYGPGQEPTPLTVLPKQVLKGLRSTRGRNTVYALEFSGKSALAMVKDLNVDPVTRDLLHIDFLVVDEDKPVKVDVPLRTTGRAKGVVRGGILNVTRRTVSLESRPADIPTEIVLDVTPLDIFETIAVKDLPLQDGVVCTLPAERTLVIVLENKRAAKAAEAADGDDATE